MIGCQPDTAQSETIFPENKKEFLAENSQISSDQNLEEKRTEEINFEKEKEILTEKLDTPKVAKEKKKPIKKTLSKIRKNAKEKKASLKGALYFYGRSFDFGRIMEGDTVRHEYHFYNSGNEPLVISNVKVSCGCTRADYPKEPLMPGDRGLIGVTFDSKGKLGRQKPFISVITNGTPEIYSLFLEGTVDTDRKEKIGEKTDSTSSQ